MMFPYNIPNPRVPGVDRGFSLSKNRTPHHHLRPVSKRMISAWIPLLLAMLSMDSPADEEQAVRNELSIARSAVGNLREWVRSSEKGVAEKRRAFEQQVGQVEEMRRSLANVVAVLDIKRRSSDLVERQLSRKIGRLERDLQAAVDARRPSDELVAIQRRTNRLRDELRDVRRHYGYPEQIAALEHHAAQIRDRIRSGARALEDPREELRMDERSLQAARDRLIAAEQRLIELNGSAAERLAGVEPPWLMEVRIWQEGDVVYRGGWQPREMELNDEIRLAEAMLVEQWEVYHRRDDAVDHWEELLVAQNLECERRMDEYQDAIWMQAFQSIVVELCDATLSVIWDLKDLGPYAVFLEAGDRLLKAATGNAAGDYSLPDGAYAQNVAGANWGPQLESLRRNAIKTAVKDAIKAAAVPSGAEPFLGYATRGARITHSAGAPLGVREALGRVHQAAAGMRPGTGAAALVDAARGVDPDDLWRRMKGKLGAQFATPAFVAGLGRDLGQGVAVEALLSGLEDERKAVWLGYARADLERSVLLANFRSFAAQRRADRVIIEEIQARIAELTAERNAAGHERAIRRFVDHVGQGGLETRVELRFSSVNLERVAVWLGDVEVSGAGDGGSGWTGMVTLPPEGRDLRLHVRAFDRDNGRELDDPVTEARFVPERTEWNGYEPGADEHHLLRLREGEPARSFVILIDCSGSMADNERMPRAKAATETFFESGKFNENDEIALWIFHGGMISRPVSFTRDHAHVREAVQALGIGGGTPLAEAILQSGRYLHHSGRGGTKALIVLTDGEAEGVGEAVSAVRRMRQTVELNTQ